MSTPLGALALRAESLGRDAAPEGPPREADVDKRHRYLKAILDEARRCQDLLATVREFASPEDPGLTRFDLVPVCRAALLLLQHEALRRQVRLVLEGDSVAGVYGRRQCLRQAVLALLVNALDASPRGGQVRIVAEAGATEVAFAVADEGEGVATAVRERLFQPFASSQPPERGLGLGLAACRAIAEGHGGSVEQEAGPNGGSRFVLRIPVKQAYAGA